MIALGLRRPLDRAAEDQGLDLVVEPLPAAAAERAGEARRHLRQHDHDRVGAQRRGDVADQSPSMRRQIARDPGRRSAHRARRRRRRSRRDRRRVGGETLSPGIAADQFVETGLEHRQIAAAPGGAISAASASKQTYVEAASGDGARRDEAEMRHAGKTDDRLLHRAPAEATASALETLAARDAARCRSPDRSALPTAQTP